MGLMCGKEPKVAQPVAYHRPRAVVVTTRRIQQSSTQAYGQLQHSAYGGYGQMQHQAYGQMQYNAYGQMQQSGKVQSAIEYQGGSESVTEHTAESAKENAQVQQSANLQGSINHISGSESVQLQVLYQNNAKESKLDVHPHFTEFPSHILLQKANKKYCDSITGSTGSQEPSPNAELKTEIFDLSKFVTIDKKSREAAASTRLLYGDEHAAATYLTEGLKTELQKVRALFIWLVSHDLRKLPETGDGQLLQRLRQVEGKSGQDSYDGIFRDLCQQVNITTERVRGYTKGASYEIGDPIGEDSRGFWTAVWINKKWRLIDVHWSAMHVSGTKDPWELIDDNGQGAKEQDDVEEQSHYKVDEYYFLTDPHQAVYSRFPDDPKWQLLSRPVTKEEFDMLAFVRGPFFDLGFQLHNQKRCQLQASNAQCNIEIKLPKNQKRRFLYQLFIHSKDGKASEFMKQDLKRYAFLEQVPEKQLLQCQLNFPRTGSYKFELFARDSSDEDIYDKKSKNCQMICAYRIENDMERDFTAFPPNQRIEWGPGQDLEELGLEPVSHKNSVIETHTGEVEILFRVKKEVPIDILTEMTHNKFSKESLGKYMLHWVDDQKIIHVKVKLPEAGDYGLLMYGKERARDGTFPPVLTYLIKSTKGADDETPFPEINNKQCGIHEGGEKLNIRLISPEAPIFRADEGETTIKFASNVPVVMSSQLAVQQKSSTAEATELDRNHYTFFTYPDEKSVDLQVQFPYAGIYHISVFGKNRSEAGTSVPLLYTLVALVDFPKANCVPYPTTFGCWGPGCSVEGLEGGELPENQVRNVRIRIPGAKDVRVLTQNESSQEKKYTTLQLMSDKTWVGEVSTGTEGSKLSVLAKTGDGDSFSHYAEYGVVKSDEKLQKEKEEKERKDREMREKKKQQAEEAEAKKQEEFINTLEKLRKALYEAVNAKDIVKLRKTLKNIEDKNLTEHFGQEFVNAKKLLASLERIQRINMVLLKLDKPAIAEAKAFSHPPSSVHPVMQAVMLLFGESEDKSKEWRLCQTLFGASEMQKRIKQFDLQKVHPEIGARAKQILSEHEKQLVYNQSKVAASFYVWGAQMVEELEDMKGQGQPATVKRQKEILK